MPIIETVPKAENIEIVEFAESKRYIYVQHIGPYFQIPTAFRRLSGFPRTADNRLCSIWLDDPEVTSPAELRSLACLLLNSGEDIPPGSLSGELPPGRYAKLNFKGSYLLLPEAWKFLFGLWLPHSGERARANIPGFEIYANRPSEVDIDDLETDLYIALK